MSIPHRTFGRFRLSTLITAGALAMVVATLAVFIAVLDATSKDSTQEEAGRLLVQLSRQLNEQLEDGLAERMADIKSLAVQDSKAASDPARARARLEALQRNHPLFSWIGITDGKGRVLTSTQGLLQHVDVSQRTWFQQGIKAPFVGDYHPALLLEKILPKQPEPWRFVDFAFPLNLDDGSVHGVVGAHLSWTWVRDLAARLADPAGDRYGVDILIVRQDGTLILGPANLVDTRINAPSVALAASGGTGWVRETWADGTTYLTAYLKSDGRITKGLGWRILVRQPEVQALRTFEKMRRTALLTGLLISLMMTSLAYWGARRLSSPLEQLADSLKRRHQGIAAGVQPPAATVFQEAEVLASGLDQMFRREGHYVDDLRSLNVDLEKRIDARSRDATNAIAELRATVDDLESARRELAAKERKIHAILEHANDAVIAADKDGNIVEWNRAAEQLLGWTAQEILGRNMADTIIPSQYRAAHRMGMANFHRTGKGRLGNTRVQMTALRSDGIEVPIELSLGHVKMDDDFLFIGFMHEISDRLAKAEQADKTDPA